MDNGRFSWIKIHLNRIEINLKNKMNKNRVSAIPALRMES